MNSTVVLLFSLIVVSVYGTWNKGPVPVFLANASDDAKESFYQIIMNPNLTQEQKEHMIEAFIRTQPQAIQNAFQEFKQKMDEIKSQFDQSIQQQLNVLSVDARNALAELNAIDADDKLTDEQKQAKVKAFFDSLKVSVQEELKQLNPMVAGPLAGGNRIPHIGQGATGIGKNAKKIVK